MTGDNPEPATVHIESVATFLPDLPLNGDAKAEAEFGHGGIAETLRTIVKQCPTPFTVALYGSWGTGKSTIVERLKSLLKKDGTPTVVIDVWKYQDDSLRRIVLKELHRQGCQDLKDFYDQDTVLDESVDLETSLATEFKLGIVLKDAWSEPKLRRQTWWLLGSLVLAGLAVGIAWAYYPLQVGPFVASVVAAVAAALATLKTVSVLLTPKTRTQTKGRYADPYEFEQEFQRLLKDGYKKVSKVLVVFDNLDRVDEDKAVEVLTTVKTFLETLDEKKESKAIFLVPCDDRAIREQVEKRFHNGDEFLRKFFNVCLRIPEFFGTELQDYTLGLLRKSKIPELDKESIAWVATKAFRSNPRQLKQFVNVLVAEVLLANRRSLDGELPKQFIKDNVEELVLFQVLQARFPRQLARLVEAEQRPLDPAELAKFVEELPRETAEDKVAAAEMEELLRFVSDVAFFAEIDDLRRWLALRSTKHERELPGVDEFLSRLEFAELDGSLSFLQRLHYHERTRHNLSLAVQERAGGLKLGLSHTMFVDSLLKALAEARLDLDSTAMSALLSAEAEFVRREPTQTIQRIDPGLLAEVLTHRPGLRETFVDAWVDILKDSSEKQDVDPEHGFVVELVKVISSNPGWFSKRSDDVKAALNQVAGRDTQLMRILAEGKGAETWITTLTAFAFADHMADPPELLGALPESAPVVAPEVFTERVDVLGMLPPATINDVVAGRVLRADVQVMDGSINPETDGDVWLSLVTTCRSSLTIVAAGVTEDGIEDVVLNDFTRVVKNVLNSSQNPSAHREAILTLIDLGNTGHHPDRNALVGFVNTYIASAPIENVRTIVSHMGGPSLEGWPECKEALLQRCVAETDLYDAVLEDTAQERRFDWMLEMLPKRPAHVLNSVGVSGLSEDEIVCLCESADEQLRDLSGQDLIAVLDAIAPLLGLPGMDYALDNYTAALGRLLTSGDETLAAAGIRLLRGHPEHLADPERACGLVSKLMKWLAGIGDKHQPATVHAILDLRERLTQEELNSLIGMLFDIATNDPRPGAVEHSLRSLAVLDVSYGDRSANFVHVQTRYKSLGDETMRAAIRDGLAQLRPSPLPRTKEAKDFWAWQKALS